MSYQEYRFTKPDGTVAFEFVDKDMPVVKQLHQFMQMHEAIRAEPVTAPACPMCPGPVCPIVDREE